MENRKLNIEKMPAGPRDQRLPMRGTTNVAAFDALLDHRRVDQGLALAGLDDRP